VSEESQTPEKQLASVDRIEDGRLAVLIIGDVEQELVVPVEHLPEGVQDGDWLRVEIEDNELVHAELDIEAKKAASERIEEKMQRLRSRGGGHRKGK
jgi:hypothetical protein